MYSSAFGSISNADDNDYPRYQVVADLKGENEDLSGLLNPNDEKELRDKEKQIKLVS